MNTVTNYPVLVAEWHQKNDLSPSDVTYGSNSRIAWKCSACGHAWTATVKNRVGRKSGCPICAKRAKSLPRGRWKDSGKRQQRFIDKATAVHDREYDYSRVDYVDGKTKVEIICHKHGPFMQISADHARGRGCDLCTRVGADEFVQRAIEVHGSRYDYSQVNYRGVMEKVQIVCPDHGAFWQKPVSHWSYGCPACAESHGERRIRLWLETSGIQFEAQKRFEHESVRRLRFDFVLTVGQCVVAIEYQGQQHYEPVSFGGGKEYAARTFAAIQSRDARKRVFCKSHGIDLVEIPHWQFDQIEEVLCGLCSRHHDKRTASGE